MDEKELLNQTLDFWKYKLNSGDCMNSDIENFSHIAQMYLETEGTAEDFAKFFGVPESYIRNLISRRVPDKPKRRVYYKFQSILKNVPAKWLNKNK